MYRIISSNTGVSIVLLPMAYMLATSAVPLLETDNISMEIKPAYYKTWEAATNINQYALKYLVTSNQQIQTSLDDFANKLRNNSEGIPREIEEVMQKNLWDLF